ncbi:hypothetical protein GJAV_G00233860 [Gymnothorax javanicus]|nr:hypothetical protein GJAV_G00233860 [Gymnothorax javanicus]
MGKPDVAPQRLRRKCRAQDSAAGGSDKLSDSSHSSHSTVDSLLDSSPTPLLGGPLSLHGPLEESPNGVSPLREGPTSTDPMERQPLSSSQSVEGPTNDSLPREGPTSDNLPGAGPTSDSLPGEGPTSDSLPGEGPQASDLQQEGRTDPPPAGEGGDTLAHQAGDDEDEDEEGSGAEVAESGRSGPPHLPAELQTVPHSEPLSLGSNSCLSLSVWKLYREEALELHLLLQNTGRSALHDPSLLLTSPQLTVLDGANRVFPTVGDLSSVTSQYSVTMETPLVQANVSGVVTYHSQSESANELQFSLELDLTDFLRPLPLSTEDYGKLWLSFSHDVKQNLLLLSDREDPFSATLRVLEEKLQLHLVEIIGAEAIMACQLIPAIPCLLHCHARSGSLTVWLRSPMPDLPDCLLYHCQRALQER